MELLFLKNLNLLVLFLIQRLKMSLDNLKVLKEHYEKLTEGNVKTGNQIRDGLIVSDAKSNLKELLSKFPQLEVKEIPKEVKKVKKVAKGE